MQSKPKTSPAPVEKVGFLGAGYILHAHAKAVSATPGVVAHAVCDATLGRAREAANGFAIPHACQNIEELIESGCDSVHVLLPPNLHFDATRRLLEAGIHAFLEKPMALTQAEGQDLAAIATRSNLRLGVGHNFLFLPGYERLRRAVQGGALGRIDHVSVDWLCPLPQLKFGPFDGWMLRDPGNVLLEIGPHLAAFACDLLGEVEEISAIAANPLRLPTGATAWRRWTIAGTASGAGFTLNL